jgi:NTP pyrophosphatase (non-canonical NTP hydrolase)
MTSIRQFYLLKLIEECSEVAQQAAKQIQFGHNVTSPSTDKSYDNKALLRGEVNDLLAVLDILIDLQELPEISPVELLEAKNKKRARIREYLKHSQNLGFVEKYLNTELDWHDQSNAINHRPGVSRMDRILRNLP